MKTNMPKIVLDQIDRAANQNRRLGQVQLGKPITLSYSDKEDAQAETEIAIDVNWKKRYYLYDRGDYFPLDIYQFNNYFGKIYRTVVNGPNGNFIDYLEEPCVNVQYSTDVYVTQDTSINVTMSLTNGSVGIYVNQIEALKSSLLNCYISASQILYLQKGWNTIDIFIYHKSSNGVFSFTGNLGKRVSTWRQPDFTPPATPTWDTIPIETVYVDPTAGPALQNILRWKNEKFTNPYSSLRGWGVYKRNIEVMKDSTNTNITVVSGWGTKSLVFANDVRPYFPSDMQIRIGFLGTTLSTVSGTDYDSTRVQTNVSLKNTSYDFTNYVGGPTKFVMGYIYKHLYDVEWDASVPVVVSGSDNTIQQGEGTYYAIDSFDDSVNKNRSDKSETVGIWAGDRTPPGKITAADIITTIGGFKKITALLKLPPQWANYSPDVVGVRVWTTANPDPEEDIMVAEVPLVISGSTSIVSISNTVSGGLHVDLTDVTTYTFYLSTYDWYGNSTLTSLPSISAKTKVKINTSDTNNIIEIDSDTNTFKIFADL